MGNGFGKLTECLSGSTRSEGRRRWRWRPRDTVAVVSDPYGCCDEGLGHSFCYVRPDLSRLSSSKVHSHEDIPTTTTFRTISGASVSANTSTVPFSSSSLLPTSETSAAAAFDCSHSFFSVPLQPVPRLLSGPISVDRGFLSGPIERGFMSGPIDPHVEIFSGPLAGEHRSFSQGRGPRGKAWLIKGLRKAISRTISRGHKIVSFSSKELLESTENCPTTSISSSSSTKLAGGDQSFDASEEQSLHWAQGKAGEDRVHVVISEEHSWVFVGIYDGFNGPDATDYLQSNLYPSVHEKLKGMNFGESSNEEVLEAIREALLKTEEGFLGIADNIVVENPELALMGSCVLAMVMKGEDVFLLNVGDSRAILARKAEEPKDSERIVEDVEALQLTVDHSTGDEEENCRIRKEHLDDPDAIVNGRVKGSLKVTRAFGAGFLKKPKWNNALLEMFRIDYVGTSPYITCNPSLIHHRLGQRDRFLILSSDGLYQYFTNEEAVAEVDSFLTVSPEGDPAQHLIEEVLFRAAKKAGLDFHELLEIPQGDRRRYHDDISVIVISLEGRIWRSSV